MDATTTSAKYLATHHHLVGLVTCAVIAVLASYVAFDLLSRADNARPRGSWWWAAGSIVMGSGIWSAHFVSMLSFDIPIELGYAPEKTLLSWAMGVAGSAAAAYPAENPKHAVSSLVRRAFLLTLGIGGMHYIGMTAIDLVPGISWDPALVVLSIAAGLLGSLAAVFLMQAVPGVNVSLVAKYRMGAALALAAGICALHYLGMAAANFPEGAVCLSAGDLHGTALGTIIAIASSLLLLVTQVVSLMDARMQSRLQGLTGSLQTANQQLLQANHELRHQAYTDPLTGLPNRLFFDEALQATLTKTASATPGTRSVVVLFIDLDGFKPVNDFYGHQTGDFVLRSVGERIQALLDTNMMAARIGGDEFVVMVEGKNAPARAKDLANHVLAAVAKPYAAKSRDILLTCSIGCAAFPGDGERSRLVANADVAMYMAKRAGGAGCVSFQSQMGEKTCQDYELLQDLRGTVEEGGLELHYQPKVHAVTGRLASVEALLRWNHPTRGAISPGVFIPMAEHNGLIGRIGQWVIDEACRQIADWERQGVDLSVAVNISVHQLRDGGVSTRIAESLQRHGVSASRLLCEITESAAMDDVTNTQKAFKSLGELGVYLSIDDFGTGYSSLSYLRQLPAKQLKIDRTFVSDIEFSEDARAVIEAVVKLAHALGLEVVAEGVETGRQRELLCELHCDELQGYLFGRPMPATEVSELLHADAAYCQRA